MRIYQAMVAIDGVRSYIYVRADNMSQAFDCTLMLTKARNPQSYVEVLTGQELHEPVDVYIRPVEDTAKSIPAIAASTAPESQSPAPAVVSSR